MVFLIYYILLLLILLIRETWANDIATLTQIKLFHLDARPTGDREVVGSIPARHCNILLWRLIVKYFPLSLQLIQEGKLSVSGKRMCTSTG